MAKQLASTILSEAHVATRAVPESTLLAIVRGLLETSRDGILVTDLNHQSLACNRKFGELFHVEPVAVVEMEVEELRGYVYPRLENPGLWRQQLDDIYAAPEQIYEDELNLRDEDRSVYLKRISGPVRDAAGGIIGRYWRFQDVSALHRRERMRDILVEISTCRLEEPNEVCRLIVNRLSEFYDAVALLSIRNADRMIFREAAGVPAGYVHVQENLLKDAYCKVALKGDLPLLVQDGRQSEEFCQMLPVKLGLTRYLGVPIHSRKGQPIGTLCIMDGRSNVLLDEEDGHFIAQLGNRVGNELDREQIYLERTAEQRTLVEHQRRQLRDTRGVLEAMNKGFRLLAETTTLDQLLRQQIFLLNGILGYSSSALLLLEGSDLTGYVFPRGAKAPKRIQIDRGQLGIGLGETLETLTFDAQPSGPLAQAMNCRYMVSASHSSLGHPVLFIALGNQEPPEPTSPWHTVHLEALLDQIGLSIAVHSLQTKLLAANEELRNTHERLLQQEKLGVVGTLSATVAHDIRNIVSSLSLECSFGESDPALALESVRDQLARFAVLCHRLLSYARPKLISRERVGANDLLRRVLELLDGHIRISGVKLDLDLCEPQPTVLADSSQFEHLFVNLILNALQAMNADPGTLRISTACSQEKVVIEVSDTGPGINDEMRERLFEPFASSRNEGFGLGLYSCRRISEAHGWAIEVEGGVTGTSFSVTMPREQEDE